jgi:hypothetical protein
VLGFENEVPAIIVWLAVPPDVESCIMDTLLLKHDRVPTVRDRTPFKWQPLVCLPEESLVCWWPIGQEVTALTWSPVQEAT